MKRYYEDSPEATHFHGEFDKCEIIFLASSISEATKFANDFGKKHPECNHEGSGTEAWTYGCDGDCPANKQDVFK